MSGWSADNAGNGDNPTDAPASGGAWTDAPVSPPPPADPAPAPSGAAPTPEPSAAWAMPEAPSDHAWAHPESGGGPSPAGGAPPSAAAGAGGSATGSAAGGWTSGPEPVAPPRLPVPLKAMTAVDIIDGAWGILKARPRTVFAITAIIMLPIELVSAFLVQGAASVWEQVGEALDPGTFSEVTAFGVGGVYLAAALQNLSLFFLGAAIARLVSSWYAGGDLSAREAVTAAFRKAPALLGAFALLLPVKVLAALPCGLGLPFVIPLVMVTVPAIMIEDLGPIAGIKRAFALARRRYWPCVGVWAIALVVELTVNLALGILPELLSAVLPEAIAPIVQAAGTVFAAFVSTPFVVGVAMLLYLDLRVRTEALDLELEATTAFARAA